MVNINVKYASFVVKGVELIAKNEYPMIVKLICK